MRKVKVLLILLFPLTLLFGLASGSAIAADATDTSVNVSIISSSDKPILNDNGKDPIYKPKDPEIINLLPQTSEIITTFIYLIIGLSLIIFVLGVYMVRSLYDHSVNWREAVS